VLVVRRREPFIRPRRIPQKTAMKVHISADMEGIATLSHDYQVDQKGFDYDRMRRIMTDEVQAAIEGARAGGADEVLVCDAHDTGRNLLVELLDEGVEVIQGAPYELGMMSGISKGFDAAFQVGYHAMRHTHAGVLGHTYTYTIAALRMNGRVLGESGLGAVLAGHFGVPLVFVSGDLHAVNQARSLVKDIVGVPTKEGIGVYGVRSLTPKKACDLIRKGAKEAISRVKDIPPVTLKKPIQMEVEFVKPLMAEYASKIPLVKRKDVKSVAYKAKDAIDAFRAFEVMIMVARSAKDEGEL